MNFPPQFNVFAIHIHHPNSYTLYDLAVFQQNQQNKQKKNHNNKNHSYHILLHSENGLEESEYRVSLFFECIYFKKIHSFLSKIMKMVDNIKKKIK